MASSSPLAAARANQRLASLQLWSTKVPAMYHDASETYAVALKPSGSLLIASSARNPRSQRDKHQNIRFSPISISYLQNFNLNSHSIQPHITLQVNLNSHHTSSQPQLTFNSTSHHTSSQLQLTFNSTSHHTSSQLQLRFNSTSHHTSSQLQLRFNLTNAYSGFSTDRI